MGRKLLTGTAAGAGFLVALTLTAMAQTTTPTPDPKRVDSACMQRAVDKREVSLLGAFTSYATTVKSALETRRSNLENVWKQTDKKTRQEMIQAAWRNYKTSEKEAKRTLRATRHDAWRQFRLDRKACHVNDEEGVDIQRQDINS